MSYSKNLTVVQLLFLALITEASSIFTPLELPMLHSTQCRETNLDMSNVLKTVQEMLSNPTPSSPPLSCLEVRESSPSSPSGYYTLSDGTGKTAIVYCDMDDPYTCPSLEQALRGIQVSLTHTTNAITSQLDSSLDVSNSLNTAINNTVNSVLNLTQKLINLHRPGSCQEALDKVPDLTSGTYTLFNQLFPNEFDVYCHFEDLCNTSGPWTRVAFLNMSDSSQNCPSESELYTDNGVRACGRPHPLSGHCLSIELPVSPTRYSQVCGRLTGYQYYSINGFNYGSIDEQYVDGISLTHGSPRQHIWTFAAERYITGTYSCPCAVGGKSPPAFVGSDYYCESGSNGKNLTKTLYTSDPLWDGQGCVGDEAACCQATGIPWFHKVFNTSTNDFIELRICGHGDEDTPLSLYEIYVK